MIGQLTGSCREKKKNEMIDVSFISYHSFTILSRWNVYVSNMDLGKTGCDNDPVRCGLAVCACLLLISQCRSEFTRLQLRKNESHQTLMNATLRLLLSWFASPSWHWFPALGLTGETSTHRCTSVKVSFSELYNIPHFKTYRHHKRDRNELP